MPDTDSALETLVLSIVPQAWHDSRLKRELRSQCEDILQSRIGQNYEADIGFLTDLVKRHLIQFSPNGNSALRFTNLVSRFLDQSVLSRKHASIQFLYSLASSAPSSAARAPQLLSLASPPNLQPPSSEAPKTHASNGGRESREPSSPYSQEKSQAEKLAEYRLKTGRSHLSEKLLLRDTLYLLQGISGKYVLFAGTGSSEDSQRLIVVHDTKYIIPPPTEALIHRLSEVGHLYSRVEIFVKDREAGPGVGMIEQSLCHYLQSQLTEYYRLVAILESQLAISSELSSHNGLESRTQTKEGHLGLSLRRLDVWIGEWKLRMRMMSVCVEGARNAHGGALVNLIHGYTDNGDPFVRQFTDQLLEEVSSPFFSTLHKWLFSGELYDPFLEFFVALDPELAHIQYNFSPPSGGTAGVGPADNVIALGGDNEDAPVERESGLRLWEAKYQFRQDMLPMFVGEAFGKKIFSTGKSLNFIRYTCHDSEWVATREKMSDTGGILKYSDIAGLERSIDAAYQTASRRLFEVFLDKFQLLDHFFALKHYLLLGYGDFSDQLMEALGPSLSRPANTLYRHNLTATLEAAIRSSNAQNDPPNVLRRLDARMLEYSHGEIGWDVFTLEYKVDAPIDTLLDPDSMIKYLKLFNHLWKMKRIESILNSGWMRVTSGTRVFLHISDLEPQWHQIRMIMAEMIHFIRQIQAYSQLEVIECSWKTLLDFFHKKEGDLDAMINAHRSYLDRMVNKILFLSSKHGKEENLLNQVRDIFSVIVQSREAMDEFYNHCLSESARRDGARDEERGVVTGIGLDAGLRREKDSMAGLLHNIKEYGTAFSDKVQTFVQGLQTHSDLDCRFLAIRLSFSDFYKTKKDLHQKGSA